MPWRSDCFWKNACPVHPAAEKITRDSPDTSTALKKIPLSPPLPPAIIFDNP